MGGSGGGPSADMNVTPLIDVLLVLLIIFMLTAHVMESGIEVDVPAVKETKETTKDLAVISITKDARLYLGEKTVNVNELAASVLSRYGKNQTVYVRADKQVTFEIVAQVLAELGAAKIGVSVVTKPEDTSRRPR
jgi:biopolymer transport protein ExbD/biopolymer transport protein TolR